MPRVSHLRRLEHIFWEKIAILFRKKILSKSTCESSGVRRKLSRRRFHSVAYGGHLYLVCAVCDVTIWRHIHVYKPTFWRSLLTQYAYSSTRILLILCVIALNINYQRSKLGYWRKMHSAVHNCKNIGLCVKPGE